MNRLSIAAFAPLLLHLCLTLPTYAADSPLKVFILAGQSNMQGHAHVDTLQVMPLDPKTKPIHAEIVDDSGEFRTLDEVWISSLGSAPEIKSGQLTVGYGAEPRGPKIGPELGFGIYMHKHLNQPILIIKTAWGGKSLNTDFRSPSAGPYRFNESQLSQFEKQNQDLEKITAERNQATGVYYRLMMEHVEKVLADIPAVYPDYDPQAGYELAGFVWFQGWNDMVDRGTYPHRDQPGGYQDYSDALAHFIRDVRKDLNAPQLPFVIGVLGVGGPTSQYDAAQKRYQPIHDEFRNAMAAPAKLPEFQGNVAAVRTEIYWDQQLTRLRAQDAKLRQEIKQRTEAEKLSQEQSQAQLQSLRTETFSDDERFLLEHGASNAEFHYLGSAKIMTQIGKGFAEAMIEMLPADN